VRRKRKTGCAVFVILFLALVAILLLSVLFLAKDKNARVRIKGIVSGEGIPYQKTEFDNQAFSKKYYYEKLPEEEQQAYQEILQGIRENQAEIYVHAEKAERTNQIFQYVIKDSPEIFWCEGTTTATSYGGMEPYTVLKPVYQYDSYAREQMQKEIDTVAEEWLSGISQDASDYEKILYAYEHIVDSVQYDTKAEDNQNIYSVLVRKRSVCAGYSRTMQYLLEKLGVFCTYVTGTVEDGQSHAWNIVYCDGDYYHVDATWGDPVFQTQEGEESDFKYIGYDYMCCSDEEIYMTHTPDSDIELPACTKMDKNYYVVNGMYYPSYDGDAALDAMKDVIDSKENPAVFKYPDEETYKEAREGIFQDVVHQAAQYLADSYGLMQVKYSYIDDEKLHKIVVYWDYS